MTIREKKMESVEATADMFGLSALGANSREAISREINLAEAVVGHMKCKVRLRDYVDGKTEADYRPDPDTVARADQCLLGKWIHGAGRQLLGENEKFNQLSADHARFHEIAAAMVRSAQADDHSSADAAYKGEFQKVSRRVVQALTELDRNING